MNNEKKLAEIREILRACKTNSQRLAILNQLKQDLIDDIALEKGFDTETAKGLNLAQVYAMRKFPELWDQSLLDKRS